VRIIDFGIARSFDVTSEFTTTGVVMGSLGWTSPEQLDARDPMPAMDIFAWGCLIAYAATGKHPFGGGDAASRCWRILNADPELGGLPPVLRELVAAALDRETERRPTAQELLLGLVGAAGPVLAVRGAPSGPSPVATPADAASARPGGRWWTPERRSRRTAVLIGVPLGLLLAAAISSAAGGPFPFGDDPAGAGGPRGGVSTPSGPAPEPVSEPAGGSAEDPETGGDGRGGASETGPILGPGTPVTPGAPTPTLTPAPTTTATEAPPEDDGHPGKGKGLTKSKNPRG
jgi:hypothetical protein